MKCPYCGEINKDGANFCVNCEYKFTGRLISNREKPYPFLLPESYLHVTPESHNDQTHSENVEKEKPKKRNHRILLLAAVIPAVLVLIFIVKFKQDSFTKGRSQSASYSNVKILNYPVSTPVEAG